MENGLIAMEKDEVLEEYGKMVKANEDGLSEGKFLQNFRKCELLVYFLVQKRAFVKGDYFLLDHYFYRTYQPYLFTKLGHLNWKVWKEARAFSPETIDRAYRKLKEMGLITETEKTRKKRRLNEEFFKRNMPEIGSLETKIEDYL